MRGLRLLLLFLFVSPIAFGQTKQFDLDLSSPSGTSSAEPVDPGVSFGVRVINRTPAAYQVDVQKVVVPISALSTPSPLTLKLAPANTCTPGEFKKAFDTLTTEGDVATLVNNAREDAKACTPDQRLALEAEIRRLTTFTLGPYTLRPGQELKVTVSRKDSDTNLTWTFVASTGTPGEWHVSYGFNFIPSHDDHYYLVPSADGKQYTITPANRRDDFAFAPSVFFSFLTNQDLLQCCSVGPVAGLGFDMSNPVVFGGLSVGFRQNVSLNVGIVMHQENRLNGKYTSGSTVTENLSDDQLYQKTYRNRFFVGLAFRFDSNPFSKPKESAK